MSKGQIIHKLNPVEKNDQALKFCTLKNYNTM